MAALATLFNEPTVDHIRFGPNVIVLNAAAHQQLSALLGVEFVYLREGWEEINQACRWYLPDQDWHFDPDNRRNPLPGRMFSLQLAETYLPAIAVLVVGEGGRYAAMLNVNTHGYCGHFGAVQQSMVWATDIGKTVWGMEAMASVLEHWTIAIRGGVILGTNPPVSPTEAKFITADFFVWKDGKQVPLYDAWVQKKGSKKRQRV